MDLSFCKQQINEYNAKIREYGRHVRELRGILTNLTEKLDDEINAVNKAMNDLASELEGAVKYSGAFKANADYAGSRTEGSVYSVNALNNASNSIQAEIRRISNLSETAQGRVNYYTNEYNDEKRRQQEEKKKK